MKLNYILSPYNDPSRPLFVPQEAPNFNDDFLLPGQLPSSVANFSSKMNKIIESPVEDHLILSTLFLYINTTRWLNFIS